MYLVLPTVGQIDFILPLLPATWQVCKIVRIEELVIVRVFCFVQTIAKESIHWPSSGNSSSSNSNNESVDEETEGLEEDDEGDGSINEDLDDTYSKVDNSDVKEVLDVDKDDDEGETCLQFYYWCLFSYVQHPDNDEEEKEEEEVDEEEEEEN